jgi:hypothetical protein
MKTKIEEIRAKEEVRLISLFLVDNDEKIYAHFSHYCNGKFTGESEITKLTHEEFFELLKPALISIKDD